MKYRKRILGNHKKKKYLIVGTLDVAREGVLQTLTFSFSCNTLKNQKLIATEPAHRKLKDHIKNIFEDQQFGIDAVHNVTITNIIKAV
jgi:hypothetical protein